MKKLEKTKEFKLEDVSILSWITENGILTEKDELLDFYDHAFLLDILTDWSANMAVKACSQVGKSVTFSLKTLFACAKFKWNIIYTMPTDDDVKEFVGTKTNKILQANPQVFKGIQTDNIERKEIDGRFIYYKGTISKSAAISTTADLVVHDEASRSDQSALNTYKSRTKDSPYKGRWLFSNPTIERDALDLEWQKSDQKEWNITCPHCGDVHPLMWPESIDVEKRCYICRACKKPISDDVRRKGKWIDRDGVEWGGKLNPRYKVSGWHLSHLIATKITAEEIIADSDGDPEYFNNFILGEPYNPGDVSVSRTTILDLWTPKDLSTGNVFIGVDVGNLKHYVIRSEKGLLKVGRFSAWSELDTILAFWKPKSGVIDAMPDNTAVKHYVENYPFMQMSFFKENADNPQTIVWWGDKEKKGIVYSHRDRILDRMLTDMIEAKYLIGVTPDKDFNEYIKHYETLRRMKVVNAKGIERYVWESTTGVDHYCFADLYSYIALLGTGSGVFYNEGTSADKPSILGADNVYISDAFREANQQNDEG